MPTEEKPNMGVEARSEAGRRVLDKRLLRQSVAALQARLGLIHDPNATGEQAQAITLRSGVSPDDRVLSSEILRMRQDEKESIDW
jgi:hypothetical protein